MSKLESFSIEMRPMYYRGDPVYEIKVRENGEVTSLSRAVACEFPEEAEIEMLTRMSTELIRGIRERRKRCGTCCCCQERKRCPKY